MSAALHLFCRIAFEPLRLLYEFIIALYLTHGQCAEEAVRGHLYNCLRLVWAASRISHLWLFSSLLSVTKKRTLCTVSWLSARTPETSLEMEKEAETSAWSSPESQWFRKDTGIPCRAWGNRRCRGKLGHAAWAGEWIVKELPRRYLSESREELQTRRSPSEREEANSAPARLDSET